MPRRVTQPKPTTKMDVTLYKDAGCPETLLPTYGRMPRRPLSNIADGNRAARTVATSVLPGCLDPWKVTLPMRPPVLYYGYPLTEEKTIEIAGPIEYGPLRKGEVFDMSFYAFKAHTIIQSDLGWKFPLELVYAGGCPNLPDVIVFWTNYTNPKTRAALEKRIGQVKELLGFTDEPKWYLAVDNRWHWA